MPEGMLESYSRLTQGCQCLVNAETSMWISLEGQMISGAHVIVYSKNAEANRAFFATFSGSSLWMGAWLADLRPAAGRSGIPPVQ
jgi:hypothetical protein